MLLLLLLLLLLSVRKDSNLLWSMVIQCMLPMDNCLRHVCRQVSSDLSHVSLFIFHASYYEIWSRITVLDVSVQVCFLYVTSHLAPSHPCASFGWYFDVLVAFSKNSNLCCSASWTSFAQPSGISLAPGIHCRFLFSVLSVIWRHHNTECMTHRNHSHRIAGVICCW